MKSKSIQFFAALIIVAGMAGVSFADIVVYDNLIGGSSVVDTSSTSDRRTGILNAGAFSLASQTRVRGVEWSGGYFFSNVPLQNDSFRIDFFEDLNGTPDTGALVSTISLGNSVSRVDSGFDIVGANSNPQDVYYFSAEIDLSLNAGQIYWISITNETPDNSSSYVWNSKDVSGVDRSFSVDNGISWISDDRFALDFRLTAVPEPVSAVVLLSGAVVFLARRRKR